MSAVFLTEWQRQLALQGRNITSLICGSLGWGHRLHFLFSEIVGGKIMKPKSCFASITFSPLNSWHVLPINEFSPVVGIHDLTLKMDF